MYEKYFNHEPQAEMQNFFIDKIAPLGYIKKYKKNDQIDFYDASTLSIVITGKVKICIFTKNGLEKTLFFLEPGEIYGEESLFYPHVPITPIPLENTTISFISNDIVKDYLFKNPNDYKYFFQSIVRKYEISLFQMNDVLKRSPKAQICSTLYRMAVQNNKPSNTVNSHITIYLTHELLASIVGCSRVTVTRVLRELKNENIIDTSNRQIVILNFTLLKKYADL